MKAFYNSRAPRGQSPWLCAMDEQDVKSFGLSLSDGYEIILSARYVDGGSSRDYTGFKATETVFLHGKVQEITPDRCTPAYLAARQAEIARLEAEYWATKAAVSAPRKNPPQLVTIDQYDNIQGDEQ